MLRKPSAKWTVALTLITACVFALMPGPSNAASDARKSVVIDLTQTLTVDQAHPAKLIDIEVDANAHIIVHPAKDITVAEAQVLASQGNDQSDVVRNTLSSKTPAILASTGSATCHTYQAVQDPVNIVLTSVQHDLNWTYTGSSVGLNWMNTSTNYHVTTGWSLVSGPSQWIVVNKGGWYGQTHGEATFQWIGGQHYHTLKNDNQGRADGTCQGIMQISGSIPSISHLYRSVWVSP